MKVMKRISEAMIVIGVVIIIGAVGYDDAMIQSGVYPSMWGLVLKSLIGGVLVGAGGITRWLEEQE